MTIKHVTSFNGKQRVRVNRSERDPPYLANVVKGVATQLVPNGVSYGGAPEPKPEDANSVVGVRPVSRWWHENEIWPGANKSGNRSGE